MQREVSRIGRKTLQLMVREMQAGAFEAMGWNVVTWAGKAGVAHSTIYNLLAGRTRFPQFETIVRLCNAVHLQAVPMESGSVELRLRNKPRVKTVIRVDEELVGANG